jgi:hypothetical protein
MSTHRSQNANHLKFFHPCVQYLFLPSAIVFYYLLHKRAHSQIYHLFLRESDVESRDEGLSEPEGEDELWSSHEKLGYETLKERCDTLVLHHAADDLESAFWVLEVSVLDASLNNIKGCGDNKGGGGTGNRGNEVLEPGSFVVIAQAKEVSLSEG